MKFSVVIPVYDKAKTIASSIDSVLGQSFHDFELIVVDDGSTDGLAQVLECYEGRLRVIAQPNSGVSVARNTGIRAALGDYVCFLDADDEWRPDHLEVLADLIARYPQHRYFVTSHVVRTPDGTQSGSSGYLDGYEHDFECTDLLGLLNMTSYGVIHTNSICIGREIFRQEDIWFQPGAKIGEDTDVWYRVALRRTAVVSREETTVYHRENSTATKDSAFTDDWIFYARGPELLADDRISDTIKASLVEVYDRYLLTGSREHMVRGRRKIAKEYLRKVRCKRGKRYYLGYAFVMMPVSLCRLGYKLLIKNG